MCPLAEGRASGQTPERKETNPADITRGAQRVVYAVCGLYERIQYTVQRRATVDKISPSDRKIQSSVHYKVYTGFLYVLTYRYR